MGKTVIALGLITLLFGIFQLWGTGVIEAQAQRDLDSELSSLLEASDALGSAPDTAIPPSPPASPEPSPTALASAEPTAEEPGPAPSTPNATQVPTPTATPEPTENPRLSDEPHPAWLAMLYRDRGSAIARIQIPRIDLDKTVVEGVRVSDLRKGPGHYPATPMPGQAGNAAIAGHRTTYGAPFGDIDQLIPGDEIMVTTIQGQFTYQVVEQGEGHGHIIVPPTAVEVLNQNFRDHPNRLTLTACHPKGSARQRIIVVAELASDPAPTYARPGQEELAAPQLADENLDESEEEEAASGPPGLSDDSGAGGSGTQALNAPAAAPPPVADSFGEGLGSDSDALIPAILWGLAALAVWFSALFAGHRWKKLPAYALSALPFLVVLFLAFWHIDRVIPSY